MSHTVFRRGASKRARIDINEERECRYWAERLGVYPGELRAAVGAVGNDLDDLWRYIDDIKHEPPAG